MRTLSTRLAWLLDMVYTQKQINVTSLCLYHRPHSLPLSPTVIPLAHYLTTINMIHNPTNRFNFVPPSLLLSLLPTPSPQASMSGSLSSLISPPYVQNNNMDLSRFSNRLSDNLDRQVFCVYVHKVTDLTDVLSFRYCCIRLPWQFQSKTLCIAISFSTETEHTLNSHSHTQHYKLKSKESSVSFAHSADSADVD
jgi:hypothetical protein